MSEFNKFRTAAKRTAGKITTKAGELADLAAVKLKIKGLQLRIDEQYEALGKLVYRDLHTEEDLEADKLAVIAAIDGLFDKLAELEGRCAAAGAEAERAEAEGAEAEGAEAEGAAEESEAEKG